MDRLLRKIPNNLKDLPEGFNTKEELLNMILNDSTTVVQIKDKSEILAESLSSLHDILLNRMFFKIGWQLKIFGCKVLMRHYNWQAIDVTGQESRTGKVLLNFSKIVNSPWYFDHNRVIIWNQPIYFEIQMFDGNIKNFVDFYVPKNLQ